MKRNMEEFDWEKQQGLLPAVVQDSRSGQVLMLAYMNRQALEKTLQSGRVTFWSRSRKRLWTKGESSGNVLELVEIRRDCDGDALLVLATPQGPTCHRNTRSCFCEDDCFVGLEFLAHLEKLVENRRREMPPDSYTTRLFQQGLAKISQKVGEEAVEVIVSALQDRERSVDEAADLLYHLLVFLAARQSSLQEVVEELQRRHHAP